MFTLNSVKQPGGDGIFQQTSPFTKLEEITHLCRTNMESAAHSTLWTNTVGTLATNSAFHKVRSSWKPMRVLWGKGHIRYYVKHSDKTIFSNYLVSGSKWELLENPWGATHKVPYAQLCEKLGGRHLSTNVVYKQITTHRGIHSTLASPTLGIHLSTNIIFTYKFLRMHAKNYEGTHLWNITVRKPSSEHLLSLSKIWRPFPTVGKVPCTQLCETKLGGGVAAHLSANILFHQVRNVWKCLKTVLGPV